MKKISFEKIKPYLYGLFAVFMFGIFLPAKGPELHKSYIRNHVGSKSVMLFGQGGGGSGFFVEAPSGDTYILTNAHVCRLANSKGMLEAKVNGGQGSYLQKIIKIYEKHDLCLVESIAGFSGLEVARSLRRGEHIGIVGHPKLQPLTVSTGDYIGNRYITLLSAINTTKDKCDGRFVKLFDFLKTGDANSLDYRILDIMELGRIQNICIVTRYSSQITAYSRGGSSGSPVVNFYGNVSGVLFAGNVKDQFESFMVPLHYIQDFLQDY